MIDGISRTDFGDFILTEELLKELLEARVTMNAADKLDLFDGVDLDDALTELYPGLGETPYDVADSLVASIQ